MSDALRKLATRLRDGGWDLRSPQELADMIADQIDAALSAQPVQEDARAAHSVIIKALAAIVNVHQTDKQFDAEVIPRNPVMAQVMRIRVAADKLAATHRATTGAASAEAEVPK